MKTKVRIGRCRRFFSFCFDCFDIDETERTVVEFSESYDGNWKFLVLINGENVTPGWLQEEGFTVPVGCVPDFGIAQAIMERYYFQP